jgi:hypothetical protein
MVLIAGKCGIGEHYMVGKQLIVYLCSMTRYQRYKFSKISKSGVKSAINFLLWKVQIKVPSISPPPLTILCFLKLLALKGLSFRDRNSLPAWLPHMIRIGQN